MPLTKLSSKKDLFRILFNWKIHATAIFVTIVTFTMILSYSTTPIYESKAKLLVLPKTSEGIVISSGEDEKKISFVRAEDINTEIELLQSDAVLKETIARLQKPRLGLKTEQTSALKQYRARVKKAIAKLLLFLQLREPMDPRDLDLQLLRSALTVEPIVRSNIILVKMHAQAPKAAAHVLDTLLGVYIRHHNEVFTKHKSVDLFSLQANEFRTKLSQTEKTLNDFQEKYSIVDIDRQNTANIDLITSLNGQLKNIQISIDESQARFNMLRKHIDQSNGEIVISRGMRTIPSIVELEKGLVPLLIKRTDIQKNYKISSREYISIENQINWIRMEIKKEILNAIRTDEIELQSLRAKEGSLSRKINELKQEVFFLNRQKGIIKDLEREILVLKNNYVLYASKAEDARIQGERVRHDLANISIADGASVPARPVYPNKLLMLIVSLFLGVFAAIGTPFFLEFLDHRLKVPCDVEELLSLPVICSLPEMRGLQSKGK